MTDPNSPDDTLPPEYQDTEAPPSTQPAAVSPSPAHASTDVIAQAKEALKPGGIVDQEKAAVAKLASDEKALEADPKVRVALVIDAVRAKLDEIAPLLAPIPGPLGDVLRVVKSSVDEADDLLANIGL